MEVMGSRHTGFVFSLPIKKNSMEMLKNYGSWVSLQSTSITEPGKKKLTSRNFTIRSC